MTAAFDHQAELELRVEVPRALERRPANFQDSQRLLRSLGDLMIGDLHAKGRADEVAFSASSSTSGKSIQRNYHSQTKSGDYRYSSAPPALLLWKRILPTLQS